MKPNLFMLTVACLALLVTLSPASAPAAAQAANAYTIDWYTVDGGGAMTTSGGTFTLSGTIGQPDAGQQTGGTYTLNGGFWNDLVNALNQLYHQYLPVVQR